MTEETMYPRKALPPLKPCIFLLALFSCRSVPPVSEQTYPVFRENTCRHILKKVFREAGSIETYPGNSMTDPIDGAAEEFLGLGCLGLAVARLEDGSEIHLFDMGTPASSYSIFLSFKEEKAEKLSEGICLSAGEIIGWKGRFFFRLPERLGKEKAKRLFSLLEGSNAVPALVDALPREDMDDGSFRIHGEDPFGLDVFSWGISAKYRGKGFEVFKLASKKDIPALARELEAIGGVVKINGNLITGKVKGLGRLLFLRGSGNYSAVITESKEMPIETMKAIAARTLELDPLPPLPPWKRKSHPAMAKKERNMNLKQVEEEIGRILERFIEGPAQRLPLDDLAGKWKIQYRLKFLYVTCTKKEENGKTSWRFTIDGLKDSGTWIELHRYKKRIFKGRIRALVPGKGFLKEKYPIVMRLSADGSELFGDIKPPGKRAIARIDLLRALHVAGYKALTARLERLLRLREEMLSGNVEEGIKR